MNSVLDWKLKVGNFLYKHRSFTPIPLIIVVFIIFKPVNLNEKNIILNLAGLLISLLGETIRIIAVGYSSVDPACMVGFGYRDLRQGNFSPGRYPQHHRYLCYCPKSLIYR